MNDPRRNLEDRLLDLEMTVKAFDDLAYTISENGEGHPAWLFTIKRQVDALRAAHEALYTDEGSQANGTAAGAVEALQ